MEAKTSPEALPSLGSPKQHAIEKPDTEYWIMLKDCRFPMGHQLVLLARGEVVDDPRMIRAIHDAYAGRRPPMRPISKQDLLDGGLL